MKRYEHPARIDTSLKCFLVFFIAIISYAMAGQFSAFSRLVATVSIFMFGILFAAVWVWWLEQFEDTNKLYLYFTLVFIVMPVAGGFILNYLIGPLQEGVVPIIAGVGFLYRSVQQVPALPSVFIQYGGFAFACSLFLSVILDALISRRILYVLPKSLRNRLLNIDNSIDSKLVTLSDKLFFVTDVGFLLGVLGILLMYVAVFLVVSVAGHW